MYYVNFDNCENSGNLCFEAAYNIAMAYKSACDVVNSETGEVIFEIKKGKIVNYTKKIG